MEIVIALVAAGLGALVWRQRRRWPPALPAPTFDEDAEIALAVARHEATARGHGLAPLHVLYGLLQNEAVAAAIQRSGGDPSKLEDRVLDELGRGAPVIENRVLGYAVAVARQHGRPATCTDLWKGLLVYGAIAQLADTPLDGLAVLYCMAHGVAEANRAPAGGVVEIVLHNDDYTTRDFVVAVLRDVFEYDEPRATALMMAAHENGRARLGRLAADLAWSRLEIARQRARAQGHPLRIEAEQTGIG